MLLPISVHVCNWSLDFTLMLSPVQNWWKVNQSTLCESAFGQPTLEISMEPSTPQRILDFVSPAEERKNTQTSPGLSFNHSKPTKPLLTSRMSSFDQEISHGRIPGSSPVGSVTACWRNSNKVVNASDLYVTNMKGPWAVMTDLGMRC